MRALVTGASGFVGQHVCKELIADGWEIHGAAPSGAPPVWISDEPEIEMDWQRDAVTWYDVDVRNDGDIAWVLQESFPDVVFHLAAVAHLQAADSDPGAARDVNVGGTGRLLAAIARARAAGTMDPTVVIAGSAEEYGVHPAEEQPLVETAALEPVTEYGRTKVEQEQVALAAFRDHGVQVVLARAFNHTGFRQSPAYLIPGLVERVVAARKARRRTIRIGNPDSVRDFLNVKDVARAYLFLAMKGIPGEVYNIASGLGYSVRELVERVLEAADHTAGLEIDPALSRAVDVPMLVGDSTKLRETTSWEPETDLHTLLVDMVNAAQD